MPDHKHTPEPQLAVCQHIHMQSTPIVASIICSFVFSAQIAFAESSQRCSLPDALGYAISKSYPDTHVVGLADLDDEAKRVFLNEHPAGCPGLVAVDFYGDGKPSFAIV